MQIRETDKSNFGDRLKMFRAQRKLSQRQLARLSKTTVSQISRYENGLTMPNGFVLQRMVEALKVSYSELMGNKIKIETTIEDFEITLKKALKLPESSRTILKDVIEKYIEINEIQSLVSK